MSELGCHKQDHCDCADRSLACAHAYVWTPIAADPDPAILQQLIESGRAEVKR